MNCIIDQELSLHKQLSRIGTLRSHPLDEFTLTWPNEEEYVKVDSLVRIVSQAFSNKLSKQNLRKVYVEHIREEAKICANESKRIKPPIKSFSFEAPHIASIIFDKLSHNECCSPSEYFIGTHTECYFWRV